MRGFLPSEFLHIQGLYFPGDYSQEGIGKLQCAKERTCLSAPQTVPAHSKQFSLNKLFSVLSFNFITNEADGSEGDSKNLFLTQPIRFLCFHLHSRLYQNLFMVKEKTSISNKCILQMEGKGKGKQDFSYHKSFFSITTISSKKTQPDSLFILWALV